MEMPSRKIENEVHAKKKKKKGRNLQGRALNIQSLCAIKNSSNYPLFCWNSWRC